MPSFRYTTCAHLNTERNSDLCICILCLTTVSRCSKTRSAEGVKKIHQQNLPSKGFMRASLAIVAEAPANAIHHKQANQMVDFVVRKHWKNTDNHVHVANH